TMDTGRSLSVLPLSRRLVDCLVTSVAAFVIVFGHGQHAWPQASKIVKIIVPVPPGGAVDFLARLLGEQVSRSHGLTVVVESRPGAGGRIATEAVARLAPDGATFLMTYPSLVIDPHVRRVNYQPLENFEPICSLVDAPNVIVVNSASPYRTLGEL